MYTRRGLIVAILTVGFLPGQEPQPSVQVTGAVKQPITLTSDDLAKMPRASARVKSSGMETLYEGVWLHNMLKRAGAAQGSELRGKALASYVLAAAQDGYEVVFSWPKSIRPSSIAGFCWQTPETESLCSALRGGFA